MASMVYVIIKLVSIRLLSFAYITHNSIWLLAHSSTRDHMMQWRFSALVHPDLSLPHLYTLLTFISTNMHMNMHSIAIVNTSACVCVCVPFTLIWTSSRGRMKTWCSGSRTPELESFTANLHDSCLFMNIGCMYVDMFLNQRSNLLFLNMFLDL